MAALLATEAPPHTPLHCHRVDKASVQTALGISSAGLWAPAGHATPIEKDSSYLLESERSSIALDFGDFG